MTIEIAVRTGTAVVFAADSKVSTSAQEPGIRLEGAYDEVWALLYGFDWQLMKGLLAEMNVEESRMIDAMKKNLRRAG